MRIVTEQIDEQLAWNDFAETYYEVERQSQLPYVKDVVSFLAQQNLLPETLLDLGCGAGRFTLPFAKRGVQVTATDFSEKMLQILQKRAQEKGLEKNIRVQLRSWQELVKQQLRVPNLWLSMLPEITGPQMLTISQMVMDRLFIFRLIDVRDPLLTPLLADLKLPPERPEIQPQLMNDYQQILRPEFTQLHRQFFNYQLTESLSVDELRDYLQNYPEMTADKFAVLWQKLQPELQDNQLRSKLYYRFELLILQR